MALVKRPAGPRCNRCRKPLKAQSSIIRGIGPVCARSVLKKFGGTLKGSERKKFLKTPFVPGVIDLTLIAYDNIITALRDDDRSLDVDHRDKLAEVLKKESKVKVIEYALVIYADVCNQLSVMTTVAGAVKHFFIMLGIDSEETEKAYERLIKIANKACTF